MSERALALARRACVLRTEGTARALAAALRAAEAERRHAEDHRRCERTETRAWHESSSDATGGHRSTWLAVSRERAAGIRRALEVAERAVDRARRRHNEAVSKQEVITKALSRVIAQRRERALTSEQAERDDTVRARRCAVRRSGFADGWPTV